MRIHVYAIRMHTMDANVVQIVKIEDRITQSIKEVTISNAIVLSYMYFSTTMLKLTKDLICCLNEFQSIEVVINKD